MDADRPDPGPGGTPDSGPGGAGHAMDWKQAPDLGRAALDRLAERLARLPVSHPSSPDYRPAAPGPDGSRDGGVSKGRPGDGPLPGDGRRPGRQGAPGAVDGPGERAGGAMGGAGEPDGIARAADRGDAASGSADQGVGGAGEPDGIAGAGGDGSAGTAGGWLPRGWPWRRGDDVPKGQEPGSSGRPGGRDGPSLLDRFDRLPRLGGLASRPPGSGRPGSGRMDLGRLGPRPPAGPYRPWFTSGPDEPWFTGSPDEPWFTDGNGPR